MDEYPQSAAYTQEENEFRRNASDKIARLRLEVERERAKLNQRALCSTHFNTELKLRTELRKMNKAMHKKLKAIKSLRKRASACDYAHAVIYRLYHVMVDEDNAEKQDIKYIEKLVELIDEQIAENEMRKKAAKIKKTLVEEPMILSTGPLHN